MADPTCIRRAWLTLGTASVELDSPAGGWFCQSLDLGAPTVRDVVSNRPDMDGVDDRTAYMGARTVTADITALRGAGGRVDAVASSFAPFMVPSARPVLHYVLDRPGAAERTLTVRGEAYSWPIVGADQRDIQLQWVAADPVARDPNTQTAISWVGASASAGRTYNLAFNRVYPAGGGGPINSVISSLGDVPVRPLLRFYGPVTAPGVQFIATPGGSIAWLYTQSSFIVNAGHYLEVDTARKTAFMDGDRTQPQINQIAWLSSRWPVLPVLPATTTMQMSGNNTSGTSQVQAIWNDGYLS